MKKKEGVSIHWGKDNRLFGQMLFPPEKTVHKGDKPSPLKFCRG